MESPIAQQDLENKAFQLAADFIAHTSRSVFLTGKAGTGKTTFLKHICKVTDKKTAVVAPTGVAAINAGGMTMHSLFQLPFGLFIPGAITQHGGVHVTNKNTLFSTLRLSQSKRELLQELELLIIDEVSMVRCDMLDATDTILRHVRRSHRPFGGVQVLYIGDLFQLPPVAINEEWAILNDHYESPFFFHSKVIQQAPPLCIELQKIYRQNEQQYIDLLNHVRNNEVTDSDLQLLNSRLTTDPAALRNCITLTTHNYKADAINRDELKRLSGPIHNYGGIVNGDFSDKSYPAEFNLSLKKGAKVMFIRNDSGEERSYYNGRLAEVIDLNDDKIKVRFDDSGGEYELKRETWRNIRYQYNREADHIEEEELGSFSQFPIRLAWAITIHKSQGLTFKKVIIDAGDSFAAGQVYVALSRCTSLDGLILRSPITRSQISTDERVLAHAKQLEPENMLVDLLGQEKERYEESRMGSLFTFEKECQFLLEWKEAIPKKKLPNVKEAITLADHVTTKALELNEIGAKFLVKLDGFFAEAHKTHDYTVVFERIESAVNYFDHFLRNEILTPLKGHTKELQNKAKVKKYVRSVQELVATINKKHHKIKSTQLRGRVFYKGDATDDKYEEQDEMPVVKKKKEKGESARETLAFFLGGSTIEQISKTRGLAKATIENHLADFILSEEISIDQMMSKERLATILKAMDSEDVSGLAPVKQKLGDKFSYGEIKAVASYKELVKRKNG